MGNTKDLSPLAVLEDIQAMRYEMLRDDLDARVKIQLLSTMSITATQQKRIQSDDTANETDATLAAAMAEALKSLDVTPVPLPTTLRTITIDDSVLGDYVPDPGVLSTGDCDITYDDIMNDEETKD